MIDVKSKNFRTAICIIVVLIFCFVLLLLDRFGSGNLVSGPLTVIVHHDSRTEHDYTSDIVDRIRLDSFRQGQLVGNVDAWMDKNGCSIRVINVNYNKDVIVLQLSDDYSHVVRDEYNDESVVTTYGTLYRGNSMYFLNRGDPYSIGVTVSWY